MDTKLKIINVDYGIANNFGDYIEINKHLRDYPNLYFPILKHELSHTNKAFSKEDFKLDFLSDNKINNIELFKFMIKHPKSFSQLLPIYYTKEKGFVYDINLLIMYIMFTISIMLGVFIGFKI